MLARALRHTRIVTLDGTTDVRNGSYYETTRVIWAFRVGHLESPGWRPVPTFEGTKMGTGQLANYRLMALPSARGLTPLPTIDQEPPR